MKKKLYEIGSEIVNVLCIYVFLMAILWAASVGKNMPELGVGVLVAATFINFMSNTKRGGADHGNENNEQS